MAYVIGMDEAGYGPNFGPLVITATVWEVPGSPSETDFWSAFDEVVSDKPNRNDLRLHLADSKNVYSTSRGISALERTVLAAFQLIESDPKTFNELLAAITEFHSLVLPKWWQEGEFPLPITDGLQTEDAASQWQTRCDLTQIQLKTIQSEVVTAERFNQLIDQYGNKSTALSKMSMKLLLRVWSPEDDTPTLVIADKHGGRNRYDELLADIAEDKIIFRRQEGKHLSAYRIGETEIRFQTKAESHLPVALASMVCKYVRELGMELFNRFWQSHVDDLKPTKGYPQDAKRFKSDIAETQAQLGVSETELWRCR